MRVLKTTMALTTTGAKDPADVGCNQWSLHLKGITGAGTYATGSVKSAVQASFADGDTLVINDGTNPAVTFEFDKAGDGVTGGRTAVNISTDTTAAQVATRLLAAIQGRVTANALNLTSVAIDGVDNTKINLTTGTPGVAGNQTITKTGTATTLVGFTGAAAASVDVEVSVDGGATFTKLGSSHVADGIVTVTDIYDMVRVNPTVAATPSGVAYLKVLKSTVDAA